MHPDIQVLIEGGLRPHLIAQILKINRNTAANWLAGGEPHVMIAERVHELAEAVKRAIRDGKLPILPGSDSSTAVAMRTYAVVSRYFTERGATNY
jgi:hypothetical protein